MKRTAQALLLLCCGLGLTASAQAQNLTNWPQWRGANRDAKSEATGLLKEWPANGPPLVWTNSEIGRGYSGISVVDDRLYTMGVLDGRESAICLKLSDGETLWSTPLGPEYDNAWGGGPRSSPTVDGKYVYCLAAEGDLVCLEAASGNKVWAKNLVSDFGGKIPRWGYSESPLIDGEKLLCKPGNEHLAICLNKLTGETIWTCKGSDSAAYASFVKATIAGVPQYVTQTSEGIISVGAEDGELLWRFEATKNRVAVIPTPVVSGNKVYGTSGYGTGCGMVEISGQGDSLRADQVYFNKVMKNHHGGVILLDGHIYGYSDGPGWVCQNFESGEMVWNEKKALGKGCISYADGRFYCLDKNEGTVALIEASPEGWIEQGRFTIPEFTKLERGRGKIWTHPVIAQGKLFLRDQDLLFCYDILAK